MEGFEKVLYIGGCLLACTHTCTCVFKLCEFRIPCGSEQIYLGFLHSERESMICCGAIRTAAPHV